MRENQAFVFVIAHRYLYSTKNNRIQTAWSLVGAKLFPNSLEHYEVKETIEILRKKKKKYQILKVTATVI